MEESNDKSIDKVEKFISDELSNEAQDNLQRTAAEDPDQASELSELGATIEGIRKYERQSLKEQFNQLDGKSKVTKIPVYQARWFRIAAMIVVILIPLYFFVDWPGAQSNFAPGELYAQNFKAYPNFEVTINRSEVSGLSQRDYAYYLYDQKDYQEAIVNFKYAIVENPNDPPSKFFLGICLLSAGDRFQAKRQFQAVIDDGSNNYIEAAKWYLALSFLADEKVSEASVLLEDLATGGFEFKKQSAAVLSQLR